ncbi:hypothetical protein [Streptosporangium sp. 'caverna']|uniref:hypothetical protein n=1 Tax=Streptosporangium sp. 'caverna' TaxID=2202249 RepID=UPI0013A6D5C1|nr:hypothetical protein [Streptosporangium sp. 'caverna']
MSGKKIRITITVDLHLSAYAEELVETGRASSARVETIAYRGFHNEVGVTAAWPG